MTRPARPPLCLLLSLLAGCGLGHFEQRAAPAVPFDVAIVPGCPSEDDGSLSRCQQARALWAARLWERGWASNFITSGAAVHSPYVEAEALAAALVALGVPPDRIYLEPNALHTDENMYYSMQIARALGWGRVAVASNGATWDCTMLIDWGQPCAAFTVDLDWVRARARQLGEGRLAEVRSIAVSPWPSLAVRERAIARRTGRHRPPSFALYFALGLMRANGQRWIPPGVPPRPPIETWAARVARANTP
jgi:hypothetical protein